MCKGALGNTIDAWISTGPCIFVFVSWMVSTLTVALISTPERTNTQAMNYTVVVLGGALEFNRIADTLETGKGGTDTEIHSKIL